MITADTTRRQIDDLTEPDVNDHEAWLRCRTPLHLLSEEGRRAAERALAEWAWSVPALRRVGLLDAKREATRFAA